MLAEGAVGDGGLSQADYADADNARRQVEQACVTWAADLKMLLTGILKDRGAAEDALQRTVLKAIQAADTAHPETLRGWLFRIAVNEARQLQREARRESDRVRRAAQEAGGGWWMSSHSQMDEATLLEVQETAGVLRSSLERLSDPQRQVVQRRIFDGQAFSQIAAEMNVPLGTVLTWMRRALEQLRNDARLRSQVEPD